MTNTLDELRGLLDAATAGPWHVREAGSGGTFVAADDTFGAAEWQFVAQVHDRDIDQNAALIVFLRNHAEDLLAVCRAAEGVIGTYRQDRLPDASGVWAELRNALARLSPPSEEGS